jgi:transposase
MDIVVPRGCGLDIHKKTVVACLIVPGVDGEPVREVRTFATMTADLERLRDWLAATGCTHVAMESTGVYWKPVSNLLEGRFTLLLANARHVKRVPGRKTDVKDAEWLADLLRHGLIASSFVPERGQRELRELTRYRTSLVQERTAAANRVPKTLEGANIKLASVATDILGVSGRRMLAALAAGEDDPATLADLAQGRLREKLGQLEQALRGSVGDHQRFLLAQQLAHITYLEASIATVSAEIGERLRPFVADLERLVTIPGVGPRTAEVLLAEIGSDMRRFPTETHLASWAGMCPGNDESGGKRRAGKTRKGNPWLRSALVEAAGAAGRSQGTALGARYQRVAARRGGKRAAVAVGHSILGSAYHLLKHGTDYRERATPAPAPDQRALERSLVRRLEGLGYAVTLIPAA